MSEFAIGVIVGMALLYAAAWAHFWLGVWKYGRRIRANRAEAQTRRIEWELSEKLCLHQDPIFDVHCILKKGHGGGHMMATPEARIKISKGLPGYREEDLMLPQRPTTDWEKP